ncbi:MAG: hypothetical protein IK997_02130 [Bacilli bacterium]|nr:hypothetical protein [Bacilli bacterium]
MNQSNVVSLNVYYDGNDMYIERRMLRPLGIYDNESSNSSSKYYRISIYELDEICNTNRDNIIIVPKFYKLEKESDKMENKEINSNYLKDIIKLQDELTDYLAVSFYKFLNEHLDYDPKRLARILGDTCTNYFENELKDINNISDDDIYRIEEE